MRSHIVLLVLVLAITNLPVTAEQRSSLVTWEALGIVGYQHDEVIASNLPLRNNLSAEYYQRLSSESGDWGALDLQADLSWNGITVFSEVTHPFGFGFIMDQMGRPILLELHQATFELKRLSPFSTLWVGHGSPAFGLVSVIPTHNVSLMPLFPEINGLMKDWGVGGKGYAGSTDFAFSLTTNSGMALDNHGALAALRWGFGDPSNTNTFFGLSGTTGFSQPQPLSQNFDPDFGYYLGADFRTTWQALDIMAEAAVPILHPESYSLLGRLRWQLVPDKFSLVPQVVWFSDQVVHEHLEAHYQPASWLGFVLGARNMTSLLPDDPKNLDNMQTYFSVDIKR